MRSDFLTETEALEEVRREMARVGKPSSTQEIIDSGVVSRLQGYTVKPGKVSDSIFGGRGSYKKKDGGVFEFENPPLKDIHGRPLRLMVRTSRISTHDISRGDVPFKDQVLAMNHNFMRRLVAPYIGTSQIEVPGLEDNSVVILAENLQPMMFENVIRAYMAETTTETSLFVHYMRGERKFCGHNLPEGLVANGKLPYIMDTPSTKSDEHDESVSPSWLISKGICNPAQYNQIRNGSLAAFGAVSEFLRSRGLILADTKTENGINSRGEIESQDELFTFDSSRYWKLEDYQAQVRDFLAGVIPSIKPQSFSKEFARGMSVGKEGYTDEQREKIGVRYVLGLQHLLGTRFSPDPRSRDERVVRGLESALRLAING